MADIATQLVFHPTLNRSVKLLSTTLGRDKVYRTVQFFSRFLAWFLLSRGNKDEAARWNALKAALGNGRKLLRLFKPLEHLQAAVKAASPTPYPVEQYTAIARQVGYFGYLSLDMIGWAQSIRLLRLSPETAKKVNTNSQKLWLAAITFSIVNSLAKVGRIANEVKVLRARVPSEKFNVDEEAEKRVKVKALQKERFVTRYQLVIDSLDFWLPFTALEYAHVNDGLLGVLGTVTSLMALRSQWAKL